MIQLTKVKVAISTIALAGLASALISGCGSAVNAAAASPQVNEAAASSALLNSGWRCTAENPADGSGWIVQRANDNNGWTAFINDCSIGSGTPQAPCGGIQARVDPVEENGQINFYQHGFSRILVAVSSQARPDGTYEGKRPALGVTYSCTPQ